MKQHPYFKMKLWIIDLAIVMALTFMSGVWIMSNNILKNIVGWIVLGIILYLARKVVRIVRAINLIEDIMDKNNK
jgi:uncharacterized membrane protein (DUF4010 family)